MHGTPRGDDLERMVRNRLGERDIRFTSSREQVLGLIESAPGPRSAAELQELAGDALPMSTLYRTLVVLSDAGILERSHDPDGIAMFELAEWLRGHHHHFVCIRCGEVEDVEVGTEDEEALGALADRIAAARGFTAIGHRIDVEGLCARCGR
jgi:Fur family ferric uptake transcriptional regulator